MIAAIGLPSLVTQPKVHSFCCSISSASRSGSSP
jgi:hypothetical protein